MEQIIFSSRYNEIIENARRRGLTKKLAKKNNLYVEGHHVLPKSVYPELAKDKNNIVFLLASEHYEAHKELALSNPNNIKLNNAWWTMCEKTANALYKREYDISAEDYELARKIFSNIMSERNVGNTWMLGRHHSEETKMKMSIAGKGRPVSEDSKQKISDANSKAVVNINTNTIFKNGIVAQNWTVKNFKNPANKDTISRCCNNRSKSSGKDNDGNPLLWRFATQEELETLKEVFI